MRLYLSRAEQFAVAVLLVAILGALMVLSYAYGVRRTSRRGPEPPFLELQQSAAVPAAPPAPATHGPELLVHVAGAVQRPGVYRLPAGTRIGDAVKAAGGCRADGCPDALNLAEPVTDGEKVYVYTAAEWRTRTAAQGPPPAVSPPKATTPPTTQGTPAAASPPISTPQGPVNLNTATLEELQTIKGIGPVTAQSIIDYRTQHGKFTDVAQLLNVPRIGPKTLEKMQPFVTL